MINLMYIEGSDELVIGLYRLSKAKQKGLICIGNHGYKQSLKLFNELIKSGIENIYTNCLSLLNEIQLNNKEYPCELYIFNNQWTNVKEIWPNIRPANNIYKMYINGVFDND